MDEREDLINLELSTRKKYLEALASCFGVDPNVSGVVISGLIANSQMLSKIDIHLEGRDESEKSKAIENIGKMFLVGSDYEFLRFPVGGTVLALLREDIHSGYFTNLPGYVGMWTSNNVVMDKFSRLVGKQE